MTNKPLAAQPARSVPQTSQGAYAGPAHSDFLNAISPVTMFTLFFRPGLRLLTYDTPGASGQKELKGLKGLREAMERIIAGAVFGASVLDGRSSCIRRT
ncbi:MAG: hypothetical protein EPN70_08175 [Paraburkholderia sp.]|nr:hypothetical protein [Paraburkholderia sp.]TAM05567.1 MAG: hypothetical protein EPN70_08175 [Paraburkholderia sp.]TAM32383.1 MAG: hypothetical protein EPN59_00290 [Paraburkholderia sp.]